MKYLNILVEFPRYVLSDRVSLKKNFIWTLLANVIYAGCQWGILTILVKIGTPEAVGRFSLGSAIATPIIMFAQLQLRMVQATDVRRRNAFYEYMIVRLMLLSIALLIIIGLSFGHYQGIRAWVIFVFGLAKSIESLGDLYYGLFQQHERMDYVAQSKIIKGVLSFLFMGVIFFVSRSVLWGVVGLMFAWSISWLMYDIPRSRSILLNRSDTLHLPELDSEILQRLLRIVKVAMPLGLVKLLVSLNTTIPRYFVEEYWGEGILGIFTAMTYIPVVGSIIVNALAQVSIPRLAKYYMNKRSSAFASLFLKMLAITIGIGIVSIGGVLLLGRELLNILYTPEYAAYTSVFTWVMVSGGAKYLSAVFGAPVSAMQKFKVQFWIHGSGIAILGVLSYLLIPEHGMLGAVWAILVSDLFLVLGYSVVTFQGILYRNHKPGLISFDGKVR